MFTRLPKYHSFDEIGAFLSAHMHIAGASPVMEGFLRKAMPQTYPEGMSFGGIALIEDVPPYIWKRVEDTFGVTFSGNPDAYTIVLDESIRIFSRSQRGLLYGALTLVQLAKEQYLQKGLIYEAPVCTVRGAKVYLPSREGMSYFKDFIDLLCHMRMNTLMLEIGGAMEYKRHPEINEGWLEYCEDIGEYSAKATVVQEQTYPWLKNSIHVENGEGGFLTQDEVRELAAYCKERHIEIIPEVPSHSHCDYLLLRHHELAERQNDPYADTYCPSNEGSYALLFDVLDEVIDVFRPKTINMGHDEFYTVGKCDKCKDKDPVDLYVGDILRIHEYLTKHGVEMMIWGEKLLDARSGEGNPCGGAAFTAQWCALPVEPTPAIFPCRDMLPTDLSILHWYWGMPDEYDEEYLKRGYPLTYGNFSPLHFKHWRRRIERGARGGIISNWSALKQENMQRNGILFDLAFASFLFWEDDYGDDMAEDFERQAFEMLYAYANRNVKHGIRITHSTDFEKEYAMFFDGNFIVDSEYDLGGYKFVFANGQELFMPLLYGQNISCARDPRRAAEKQGAENAYIISDKRRLYEVAYTTLPQAVREGDGYAWRFETTFPLPEDCGALLSLTYVPNPGKAATVKIHKVEML